MDQNIMMNFAMMIEKYMIPSDKWDECSAPDELLKLAKKDSAQGYPTGISRHPDYGWFGLGTGQGPYVWWCETSWGEFEKLAEEYVGR